MKRPLAAAAALSAIVYLFVAGPSIAQPQQLAPIATAPTTAQPVATTPETKKMATASKERRWLKADARVCLEFPNDIQVIKCSESYR